MNPLLPAVWLLSMFVSFILGYCVTSLLWPSGLPKHLIWAFAPGIGLGVSSLIFFLFRRPLFTIEIALLVLALGWIWFNKPPIKAPGWPGGILPLALLCALGFSVSAMLFRIEHTPHGDWDSWAIWSNHARYLYRDGPLWTEHIQNSFHPDYPLLVPASTARVWRYAGVEAPDAGGLTSMTFALSGLAVLVGVLWELRGATVATLLGLTLLGTPFYLEYGVSRSADVPLSLYMLGTVALIILHFRRAPDHLGLLSLAGLAAGLAGWTKNEGLLFIVIVSLILLLPSVGALRKTMRRFMAFLAGLAAPVAVITFFKLSIAPTNDLLANRHTAELLAKLFDPSRYWMIVQSYSSTFWTFGDWFLHPVAPLLIYIGLRGIDRRSVSSLEWLSGVGIVVAVLGGYFTVYLLTPADLQWHLTTSLQRLYLQIWPLFLLISGLAAVEGDRVARV